MKPLYFLLFLGFIFSCKKDKEYKPSFTNTAIDTLFQDSISIRAILTDSDKVWYAGNSGKYGYVSLNGGKSFNGIVAQDTIMPEFRSIAQTSTDIFILNVGTPAALHKISKDGKRNRVVYTEEGEKVFYDSMKFRNDKEGIAMGDPTDGCLSIILTNDGGETWLKIPCEKLPKTEEGEAAFAASNTNIIVKGDKTWIVSGGKKSRVFYSADKGQTWEVYKTPVVQGTETQGIYSADFYNEEIGFAVGGDYTKPNVNSGNKAITLNGGKKWKKIANGKGFGYASCVQFVPNGIGDELIVAGPSGIFYSYDQGKSWKQIYEGKEINTVAFADDKTIIGAGQGSIIRIVLK